MDEFKRRIKSSAQDAAIPDGETKLTRLLDRLDERIAEHDQQQIPSNIRDWLEIEIAAMLRQSASPEGEGREALERETIALADSVVAEHSKCSDAGCSHKARALKVLSLWAALRQSAAPSGGAALRETLERGLALVESNVAHVSHGGPTQADAEKWIQEARNALK